ncbi:carbonate dehydratase [Tamilnaduibacter salinus]|uniref:Carbonic anhydrase n=1 Tax=Tamilnaduibacter salinus TaxID=1484056 RepID=A0A2A2I593_9GAMM|nr:carbonate dehydratase [Tamilnaduibacter salinus]PAV26454.1 carbonate dehydratase [Tamilnaduibacter salinus]
MRILNELFKRNREWAERIKAEDPGFFERLSAQQTPDYLWIGCADSRVPANQIVDLMPGEVFVHRNIANVVVHTDINCLSVLQFAVDVLKVKHIMVVGHYGCGGVKAAYDDSAPGLISHWLRHIQDVRDQHQPLLDSLDSEQDRIDRLCELNVLEQVRHVSQTETLRNAWRRGQPVSIHGWIYDLQDGRLRDTGLCITDEQERAPLYRESLNAISKRPVRDTSVSSG